jgi:hypothetical protein
MPRKILPFTCPLNLSFVFLIHRIDGTYFGVNFVERESQEGYGILVLGDLYGTSLKPISVKVMEKFCIIMTSQILNTDTYGIFKIYDIK